ncbi:sugar ABC transporter substrate-binding protein [Mesorhizobium sp. VK4C]|uniref:sugar ABC transporter substrate-binding protein n=1 Tax=Mesorhizobium captivum TaxID=3072319 RepID=UPI002A24A264|nr:sugar ABC transporter substrate-binding protein [Mesorhizobium sp. VK4C]MDX8500686.1 sugar ABC transporter substrate-binding protein [Mesorhizobium sp. VK4C]
MTTKSLIHRTPIACVLGLFAAMSTANADGKPKIGIAMPTVEGDWYSAVLYGAVTEAEKLGYEVVVLDAGGFGHPEKQVDQISNLIVQQVKAILTDPIDPATLDGAVRSAHQAGIPVIGLGTPVIAANIEPDAAATSSQCQLGELMADGAKRLLPKGGTIAALAGPPGAYWATERYACFVKGIAGAKIDIVAERNSEEDPATALSIANDLLQRFPKVSLFYSADDTYGVGAGRAIQQAGKCGTVQVLMAGFGKAAEDTMRGGCAQFVVAQRTVLIGRTASELADKLARGETPASRLVEVPFLSITPDHVSEVPLADIRQPADWKP